MTRRKLRLIAALAATALATPAVAQMDHSKMNMPGMTKPAAKKPAAKKSTARKPAVKKPAPSAKTAVKKKAVRKAPARRPTRASPSAESHAEHDKSTMPPRSAPGGTMPTTTMPGIDIGAMGAPTGTDLPAGNALPPPVPTANAADTIYGTPAMDMGRHHLYKFHGGQKMYQVMVNIAEAQFGKGPAAFEWDAEGWYGGDISRLSIKSEGEGAFGRTLEKFEVQALYSHAIGPYFNLQGGLRYDFRPDPSRVYAVAGFEGLAPSFFDVEGALFLSNKGELMARVEGYYDQRITQRLILQPRAELNFAAQSSREIGVGSGLSDAELGFRLRYDIRREFAPYVGVQYRRAFGDTRRFLKDEGENASGWSLLTGVRVWF